MQKLHAHTCAYIAFVHTCADIEFVQNTTTNHKLQTIPYPHVFAVAHAHIREAANRYEHNPNSFIPKRAELLTLIIRQSKSPQVCQRGLTEEMPENVHFCIQKAATHSHFIRSTPF